jgi:hypothetical protein
VGRAHACHRRVHMEIAAIGYFGLVLILWLMVMKPF